VQYLAHIERTELAILTGGTEELQRRRFFIAAIIIENTPETPRIVAEEPFGVSSADPIKFDTKPGRS
jgi:acyl-CoA reductase-like NAD-dependent aldehyde dehydrogenase